MWTRKNAKLVKWLMFFLLIKSSKIESKPIHGESHNKKYVESLHDKHGKKATIEFIQDEDSREMTLQENSKPHFRTQSELNEVEKPDVNVSISVLKKQRTENHQSHARERYAAGLGHSRESYLHFNETIRHFRINPLKYKGMSIDDAQLREVHKTNQKIKVSNYWSPDQIPVQHNEEKSKHISSEQKRNTHNFDKNTYSEYSPENKHMKELLRAREKYVNGSNRYTSQTKKTHDILVTVGMKNDEPINEINPSHSKYGDLHRDKKINHSKNRNQLKKEIEAIKDEALGRIRRISTVRNHYPGTNMWRLRPDKAYATKRYEPSSEFPESVNELHYQKQEESDRIREDRDLGRGKPGRGQKRHDQSEEERNYGHKGLRQHPGREGSDNGREGRDRDSEERARIPEGRGKGSYKYSKYKEPYKDQDDIRVTRGMNAFTEETSTLKIDRYKHSKSYESVQINSMEDNSDTEEMEKNIARTRALPNPQDHPKLKDYKSPLRSDPSCEEGPLLPHSIARQMQKMLKYWDDVANIEQEVIGRTVEYNDIVLWKIKEIKSSDKYNFRANDKKKYAEEPPEKKIVFIVHGLSVMGWHDLDCLSQVNRFKQLLDYYLENLDCFDIYLIPMANPDGVAKATADNWWNKNVSPQEACPGVHLDRNFDVGYNGTFPTMSSCRMNYPGPRPFSEHESKAVRNVFFKYGHKIVAYFHVHAGTYDSGVFKGDAVLYPYGFTEHHSDDDKYIDLKGDIDDAMRNTNFKVISVNVDTLYNWYGKVKGTSVDYASTIFGVPYALELVMQIYKDNEDISDEDEREKNTALTELWQVVLDVMFDSIYRRTVKHNEERIR